MTEDPRVTVDVHLGPDELRNGLLDGARAGLTSTPKQLRPQWFYDDRGSKLFEEITRLPEYYPTRCEREILAERAGEIAELARADTVVELGSGTSEKTRLLLDAVRSAGELKRFVPFDVSEGVLREAAWAVAEEYPGCAVHAVVGDFNQHLPHIPTGGRRLIAFLGGTIGNFPPADRAAFLRDVAAAMSAGDSLVLGSDLVKDPTRLVAAYDDAEGVTAAFNRNVLEVLNRELDARFDPASFRHVARWDPSAEWIEMLLVSERAQDVRVNAFGFDVHFDAGEEMRTEVSSKFRPDGLKAELAAAGLRVTRWWTDRAGDFALWLVRRSDLPEGER